MEGRILGFAGIVTLMGLSALPALSPAQGGMLLNGAYGIAQAKTVTMALDPASKTAAVGEVFTVNIGVDAGAQTIDVVEAFLDFNPGVLRVVDVNGTETNSVVAGNALSVGLRNTVDNTLGQIGYGAGRPPGSQAPTGSFVLATLRFKAVTGGSSSITFASQQPRNTDAFSEGVSVLAGVTGGSVTAMAGPAATSTATPPSSSGGGGGGGGGGVTPTPTSTQTATPTTTATATPTPQVAVTAPGILGPAEGAVAVDLAPALSWVNPPGTTQYQIQVLPAANAFTGQPDGPGMDIIIADQALVQQASYQVRAPLLGEGNYVMLPGMTYTWRVRTATAQEALSVTDSRWGPWSSRTFRSPLPSSTTISAVAPADESTVESLTPSLQWSNSDKRVFYYEIQLSKDRSFNTDPGSATAAVFWEVRHGGESDPLDSYTVRPQFALEAATTYFWRVRPRVQGDAPQEGVAWSQTLSFRTP